MVAPKKTTSISWMIDRIRAINGVIEMWKRWIFHISNFIFQVFADDFVYNGPHRKKKRLRTHIYMMSA